MTFAYGADPEILSFGGTSVARDVFFRCANGTKWYKLNLRAHGSLIFFRVRKIASRRINGLRNMSMLNYCSRSGLETFAFFVTESFFF